ncbi:RHS repeat domain-containing protein [Paraflavitalea sp. sgz302552]
MLMPNRSYTVGSQFRYGFNGKENDNDVKGLGNQQDYGMRIYDPRLGKFLSVDPLASEYPMLTPYQFASNRPTVAIDLDGGEAEDTNEKVKESDIPKDKHEKVSVPYVAFKIFLNSGHQAAANNFASEREKQPGVIGVVTFDYDDFNTVAVTYVKYNVIVVQPNGANSYETRIKVTYSIFRADKFLGESKQIDISEEDFFSKPKHMLFSPQVIYMPLPGLGTAGKAGQYIQASQSIGKFGALQYAAKYGVKAYKELRGVIRGAGAEAHHLIEKRFAKLFPEFGHVSERPSIILTKAEHIKFTTMWRLEVGYKNSSTAVNTATVTADQVRAIAKSIYKDYPEILKALGLN